MLGKSRTPDLETPIGGRMSLGACSLLAATSLRAGTV